MRYAMLFPALLLATACTVSDTDSTDKAGSDAERLTDSAWVFETVAGEALPDRVRVTLEFDAEAGRAFGLAACNRYTTGYTLDGSSFRVELLASTKMACPEPLMQAEARFFDALRSASAYGFDPEGRLLLTGSDGAISRAVAEPRDLTM